MSDHRLVGLVDRNRPIRTSFLVMLVAQFLIGMAVNLFVKVVVCAVVGFIGVLGAGFNGGSFLDYHEDFSSMLMATGFAIAVVSYAVGLYIATNTATSTNAPA